MLQSQGLRAAAGGSGFVPFVADVLLVGAGGKGYYGGGAGGLVVTYTTQIVEKGDIFRMSVGVEPPDEETKLIHSRGSSNVGTVTADGGGQGGAQNQLGTGPGGGGLPIERTGQTPTDTSTNAGGVRAVGGNGGNGGYYTGGGGGGALQDGGSGGSKYGGDGGYGIQNDYETGAPQWYGHGGGGGALGGTTGTSGGGAPPGGSPGVIRYQSAFPGANGFGHGGGGSYGSSAKGGTGIIIIRTPIEVIDPELVDPEIVYSVSTHGIYKVFKIMVSDNDFIVW